MQRRCPDLPCIARQVWTAVAGPKDETRPLSGAQWYSSCCRRSLTDRCHEDNLGEQGPAHASFSPIHALRASLSETRSQVVITSARLVPRLDFERLCPPRKPHPSGEFPRDLEVMCSTAAKRDRAPWVQPQAIWGLERDRLGSSEVAPMSHAARPDGDRGLASWCLFPRSFSHAGAVGVKLGGMVK